MTSHNNNNKRNLQNLHDNEEEIDFGIDEPNSVFNRDIFA